MTGYGELESKMGASFFRSILGYIRRFNRIRLGSFVQRIRSESKGDSESLHEIAAERIQKITGR
jgi:hypothetical protein